MMRTFGLPPTPKLRSTPTSSSSRRLTGTRWTSRPAAERRTRIRRRPPPPPSARVRTVSEGLREGEKGYKCQPYASHFAPPLPWMSQASY